MHKRTRSNRSQYNVSNSYRYLVKGSGDRILIYVHESGPKDQVAHPLIPYDRNMWAVSIDMCTKVCGKVSIKSIKRYKIFS